MDIKAFENALENKLQNDSKVDTVWVTEYVCELAAISSAFNGLSTKDRISLVTTAIEEIDMNIKTSLLFLYTPEEAEVLQITISKEERRLTSSPTSWLELIHQGNNNIQANKSISDTKVVAFYSFKGGVGRTTALIHVAWTLANRGKKVLIVDLDLEAPSLHRAFGKLAREPKFGLVDFLYEKVNLFRDEEPAIRITDIIGEVSVPKGKLFVVPAGKVNSEYISKIDDLRLQDVFGNELWDGFKDQITEQLQPDLILVDSRTGINVWGALSLLTIADSSVVFMNPNAQNSEGIATILASLLKVGITPNVVLSPVLGGNMGRERALKSWSDVNKIISDSFHENSDKEESGIVEEDVDSSEEPIMIPYASEIALQDEYPHKSLLSLYHDIANTLDDEADKYKLIQVLSGQERWKVIESLEFPSVDAKDEKNPVKDLFQKTADFDLYLDQNTVLVRGKKGTGKTQLYWTNIKHFDVMNKLANGRLDGVIPISGHGPATHHPIRDDFNYIQDILVDNAVTWDSFWRSYALYRLLTIKGFKFDIPRSAQFSSLKEVFKTKPRDNGWTKEHTDFILKITLTNELRLLTRDLIKEVNEKLLELNKTIWLLYDDLDQDIKEYSQIQNDSISGLFLFTQSLDGLNIRNIRTKIFLRNDIWHRLNFTNKSHFVGRDVELKWARDDFLRLALRQARLSSDFSELVAKFSPIGDVDTALEENLEKSLELLWGINREKGRKSKKVSRWVYERLTDASGSTFPRALTVLLQGARVNEMDYHGKTNIPAPTDRLLRSQSLNIGLIRASESRCDELRQEHKELDDLGFFAFLSSLNQITELSPLQNWWYQTARSRFKTFEEFLEQINQMGLAAQYDFSRWRFADIYVHGFKMSRSGKL